MPVKSKWAVIIPVIFVILAQLYILYFIKYNNQYLSFSEFNLFIPGNIINLLFIFFLVLGVIIYSIRIKKTYPFRGLITYTFITSLLLFLCFLSLYIELPKSSIYIFEQQLNKFVIGLLFAVYQFTLFLFLSFVWLRIFTEKDFIFVRILFNSIIIAILLLLVSYFYIEINMKSNFRENNYSGGKNIAVVLGAAVWSGNQPSPTLSSRIDKAVKLYKKGIINKILLTGSNAPGELTEAEVAFNYIVNKNVDTTDIYLETQTTSTTEQIRFIKNNLISSQKYDNVFVVSDRYHLTRIKEISRFYNIKIIVVASELELSFETKLYNRIRECIALTVFWCFAL